MLALGTRGDVQPFCLLGRELIGRGHEVSLLTNTDYRHIVDRYSISSFGRELSFGGILRDPEFDGLLHNYFTAGLRFLPALRRLAGRIQDRLTQAMVDAARAVEPADLVIYNPFAFFAGELARERGVPSVRITCQPMLPSWERALCLFGGRNLGAFGNRGSYEIARLLSPLMRRCYRELERQTGLGGRLHALTNPITLGLGTSQQIFAFSPTLSADTGDGALAPTGHFSAEPSPGEHLPDEIVAFLSAGPPPVYIGFGSMLWGAERNTDTVIEAVRLWGGRAILAAGAGGLRPRADLPPTILRTGGINHELLFPHLAAIVHHGGAGTTATALKHGLPSVILPVLGDQLYWGRQVAALGAGEIPVPLSRITPDALARRIDRACTVPGLRLAARATARQMAGEPGLSAAVGTIERILAERPEPAWVPALQA